MFQLGESHMHEFGNAIDAVGVDRPLGDTAIVLHRIEVRVALIVGAIMAGRQEQDRDGICKRLGDPAVGVLRTGTLLDDKNPETVAVLDAAEAVGHIDARPFMASDDRPDPSVGDRVDQLVVGKGGDPLHTLRLENLCYDIVACHYSRSSCYGHNEAMVFLTITSVPTAGFARCELVGPPKSPIGLLDRSRSINNCTEPDEFNSKEMIVCFSSSESIARNRDSGRVG